MVFDRFTPQFSAGPVDRVFRGQGRGSPRFTAWPGVSSKVRIVCLEREIESRLGIGRPLGPLPCEDPRAPGSVLFHRWPRSSAFRQSDDPRRLMKTANDADSLPSARCFKLPPRSVALG